MSGTSNSTKPLTRRLTPSKQALLFLLVAFMAVQVVMVPVLAAVQVDSSSKGNIRRIHDIERNPDNGDIYAYVEWSSGSDSATVARFNSSLDFQENLTSPFTDVSHVDDAMVYDAANEQIYYIEDQTPAVTAINTSGGVQWSNNPGDTVRGVSMIPDGTKIVVGTATGDGTIVYDSDGSRLTSGGSAQAMAFVYDGTTGNFYYSQFSSGNPPSHNLYQFDPSDGTETKKEDDSGYDRLDWELDRGDRVMWGAGPDDNSIVRYHIANDNYSIGHGNSVPYGGIELDPDADKIYAYDDGTVRILEYGNGTAVEVDNFSTGSVSGHGGDEGYAMDKFVKDGNVHLLVHSDTEIELWDTETASIEDSFTISGEVTDEGGDPISDVNITINNSENFATTTNNVGTYSQDGIGNDTYNVTAEKSGWITRSKNVTVSGSDEIVNFVLREANGTLRLIVDSRHLEHDETTGYEVENIAVDQQTGDTDREDVTELASVTSNNTSILTVDESANELVATSDVDVNDVALVTATYEGKSDNETVTVANLTIPNLDILPPLAKFEAVIGSNIDHTQTDGQNATWLLIMAAAMLGAALKLNGGTYLGLTGFMTVIIAGWVMGKTGNGTLLLSLAVVGFVAMNMAANINYDIPSRG